MAALPRSRRSDCPIGFTLDIVGDRWSLLIMRDLLTRGKSRFRELAADEGIATNVLAERLERLVRAGIVDGNTDVTDRRQITYSPTEAGLALLPVIVEMACWGAAHDPVTGAPPGFAEACRRDRDHLMASILNVAGTVNPHRSQAGS